MDTSVHRARYYNQRLVWDPSEDTVPSSACHRPYTIKWWLKICSSTRISSCQLSHVVPFRQRVSEMCGSPRRPSGWLLSSVTGKFFVSSACRKWFLFGCCGCWLFKTSSGTLAVESALLHLPPGARTSPRQRAHGRAGEHPLARGCLGGHSSRPSWCLPVRDTRCLPEAAAVPKLSDCTEFRVLVSVSV